MTTTRRLLRLGARVWADAEVLLHDYPTPDEPSLWLTDAVMDLERHMDMLADVGRFWTWLCGRDVLLCIRACRECHRTAARALRGVAPT